MKCTNAPAINIKYGETVSKVFTLKRKNGGELHFSPEDKILFVIRSKTGKPIFWQTVTLSEENSFSISISHNESESKFHVGNYEWGISIYRNAVMNDEGVPTGGTVKIPVGFAPFTVQNAVSREEGLQ